eukprot:COSAG06_NODE_1956_length_7985_cov_17.502156_1_plen_130_part_00
MCVFPQVRLLPPNDEEGMRAVLAKQGPITVSIDATPTLMQHYSYGVWDGDSCSPQTNHAVLVVVSPPMHTVVHQSRIHYAHLDFDTQPGPAALPQNLQAVCWLAGWIVQGAGSGSTETLEYNFTASVRT